MIRETVRWRQEHRPESITYDEVAKVRQFSPLRRFCDVCLLAICQIVHPLVAFLALRASSEVSQVLDVKTVYPNGHDKEGRPVIYCRIGGMLLATCEFSVVLRTVLLLAVRLIG
jgi:hypothetical protein